MFEKTASRDHTQNKNIRIGMAKMASKGSDTR